MTSNDAKAMRKEIAEIRKELNNHITEEKMKFDLLVSTVDSNTESNKELTEKTAAMIKLQQDIVAVGRAGKIVNTAAVWILKLSAAVAAGYTGYGWLMNKITGS